MTSPHLDERFNLSKIRFKMIELDSRETRR